MKILGIETSCDETAAAIIEDGRKILSNVVASSKELHDKTGGVIPEMAAREQVKCMVPVISEALASAGCQMQNLDAIAVTIGPGLIGSLLVGVETAKTLSFVTKKVLITVNHILAHIYANWLDISDEPEFPALALVVSGGHTELFLLKSHEDIKFIGGTLDDAAGEAFDKTSRLLGLGYPGGPAIAAAAEKYQAINAKHQIKLPRPMIHSDNFNFSFSGLKTAVMREVNKLKIANQLNDLIVEQLAHEIQESITDVLVHKIFSAVDNYRVKSLLIGGGVAANKRLTEKMKLRIKDTTPEIKLFIPPPYLCTDNAAYIAGYAFFHNHPLSLFDISAQPIFGS